MKQLAIRLGYQTTIAKSLVISTNGIKSWAAPDMAGGTRPTKSRSVLHPNNPHHLRYLPQTAHDVGEVQTVIHLQGEMQSGVFAFMGKIDVLDVGFRFGDG